MQRTLVLVVVLVMAVAACRSAPSNVVPSNVVQGSGHVITQTYDVSGFREVELGTIGEVHIQQGAEDSLSIQTDDNILPMLLISDEGGKLSLTEKSGKSLQPTAGITFRVTVSNLETVTDSGSGHIFVGPFRGDVLDVQLNGSGRVNLESVEVDTFAVTSDGSGEVAANGVAAASVDVITRASGDVALAGRAGMLTTEVAGSGRARLGDLQAAAAVVIVDGSGGATVHALDTLDVIITASGSVEYFGSPALTQNITGSGTIIPLGAK